MGSGVVEDYATGAEKLAVQLTELVAEGLGIKSTTFSQYFEESSTSTVRMNYYPPCPQPSKTLGILPHSDFNIFTILLQDTVPGLQVLKDNEWITVQPSQDALVVNVGDAFQVGVSFALPLFCPTFMKLGAHTYIYRCIFMRKALHPTLMKEVT